MAGPSTDPGTRTGLRGIQTPQLSFINSEHTAQRNENKCYSIKCSFTEQFPGTRHCNKHLCMLRLYILTMSL